MPASAPFGARQDSGSCIHGVAIDGKRVSESQVLNQVLGMTSVAVWTFDHSNRFPAFPSLLVGERSLPGDKPLFCTQAIHTATYKSLLLQPSHADSLALKQCLGCISCLTHNCHIQKTLFKSALWPKSPDTSYFGSHLQLTTI